MKSFFPGLFSRRAITPLHCLHHRNALSRRATPWQAWISSIAGSVPCHPPVRPPPTSARPSASCTSPAASSFPIRGMSAARAICRASASRRWRRPAPATPIPKVIRTARKAWTRCWRTIASSRRRPTFRSTPISRTASPTIPTRSRRTSRAASPPASPAFRSRTRRKIRRRSTNSTQRWRASRRRAPRSTRPAATWCSPRAPKVSSAAGPTSTRPSGG